MVYQAKNLFAKRTNSLKYIFRSFFLEIDLNSFSLILIKIIGAADTFAEGYY